MSKIQVPLVEFPKDQIYPKHIKLPVDDHLQVAIELHELNLLKLSAYHFSMAASNGDALAVILYAISLRHGWGVEANPTIAYKLLESVANEISERISGDEPLDAGLDTIKLNRRVAKQELSLALYELAMSYRQGWGAEKSKPHAAYFMYLSAKLGDKDAQNALGEWYLRGECVKKDKKLAAKWFREAERQGFRLVNMQWIWKEVLDAMATPATSHVAPGFIKKFGEVIQMLRNVFYAPNGQPFVIAGSGTLTWDMTAANLIEKGDQVLVINTGKFGDWFGECIEVFGGQCDHLKAPFGDVSSLDDIKNALQSKKYKMLTITQVDTSSGVLTPAKEICEVVRQYSPDTLVALDGVCSIAAEEMKMEEWGIDVAMTGSQKGLGVPPGLAVMVVSQRALNLGLERAAPPTSYFCQWKKWVPIMKAYEEGRGSYFATPAVQLILALHASLLHMQDMELRVQKHRICSDNFKATIQNWGLQLVPISLEKAAHTLTPIYYPKGVDGKNFLKFVGEKGVVLAGGLHPEHAAKYFRVGHMNVSAVNDVDHIQRTLDAIRYALQQTGYVVPKL